MDEIKKIEQSVKDEVAKLAKRIPVLEWASVASHGRDLIQNVVAIAKSIKAGTLTLEQGKAEADAAWNDFWQLVTLIHG